MCVSVFVDVGMYKSVISSKPDAHIACNCSYLNKQIYNTNNTYKNTNRNAFWLCQNRELGKPIELTHIILCIYFNCKLTTEQKQSNWAI